MLLEWTHNLYVLVKVSLGSMTTLSTTFITPCAVKLSFYVYVRVTVAVKNKKEKKHTAEANLPPKTCHLLQLLMGHVSL